VGGNSWSSTISNCYSTGDVSGDENVGGLAGSNYLSTISNCYATATVSGDFYVGGLVGYNYPSGVITNCYSTGGVEGVDYVGGLAGYGGVAVNSFWDIETSGQTTSFGGTGKTTDQMQDLNTFLYWGACSNQGVWTINDGNDYPRLAWQNLSGVLIVTSEPVYGGGSGTEADPYQIWTAEQLNTIGLIPCHWEKHFLLMADIDLSGFPGSEFNIIGYVIGFSGVFDGNGHTISNFTYTSTGTNYIGLFGYIHDPNTEIKNLGLIGPNVDAETGRSVGSLVGWFDSGTITNCYVEGGSVSGRYNVGGLVGYNEDGTISNCYATGSVFGDQYVGGLVGYNENTIVDCYTSGNVTGSYTVGGLCGKSAGPHHGTGQSRIHNCFSKATVTGNTLIGGLIGHSGATVTGCYSTGTVIGRDDYSWSIGGLIGSNGGHGSIKNCYSTGSASGNGYVGGLVGSSSGFVSNCYSAGDVSGYEQVGGLVGYNGGTITNCYSTGSASGDRYIGGLVGGSGGLVSNCYSVGDVSGYEQVGGLVGSSNGFVSNCYSAGDVSGYEEVGGLVGVNWGGISNNFWDTNTQTHGVTESIGLNEGRITNVSGLTTAEMQTASTFIAWGCDPVWTIDEGVDYLRLVWENKPGELITVPSDLYGGGTGEPNDPYLIYTAEQLNNIGLFICHWDKDFKLMEDIDLGVFTGTSFNIIGIDYRNPFSGVFDGNGRKIFNFIYTSTGSYNIGLFGYVRGENAEIKNLGLIDPNVDAGTGDYVGSLVGRLRYGTISNCYIEGGNVSGDYTVGGLVGYNYHSTITNCYAKGGSVSGSRHVGGLVGYHYRSTITNCYSTGSVSGDRYVGGLVGRNSHGTISNCYSTGSVRGDESVGGLVGRNHEGEVNNSFWDIETSGQWSSAGGIGKTTAEMQTETTFTNAGWDFVGETFNGIEDIWFIPQQNYPHLWWQGMQVPMKLTPRTLNCRSKGNWVKAHLILPQGFTVADVDPNRPAVLHSFGFQSLPLYVFVNENELVEIKAAFEREQVCSLTGNWPQELTVAGFLTDGNIFLGTSTVRMITPGLKEIGELSLYWLNADCVHPDSCNRIDMNRDSLVNLLDYALLWNSQVEFVSE
jgi:hypothetical protein